ncbi:MAG: hypothetical protein ABIS50_15265 [Luteolibacter sp.]|uniref:hypothetical protein n=1 Tax=Luteolibacter sp. TaxID=1962973 RepID=UPI003264ABC9
MLFTTPIPFAEALAKFAARNIVPSAADSAQWGRVPVALRERAFFSSRVESARVLQGMRDYLTDFLSQNRMENGGLVAQGRAEFVADMRELAIREGLGKVDPVTGRINPEIGENDLTDIRSIRRLQLIFDTQTESAQEHGYWLQGQDPAILAVFPVQRMIRVRPVMAPRAYHEAALGILRRKDDLTYWISLNHDFGVPWGPWGYGSGVGVEDGDLDEAIAAGVMKEGDVVKPIAKDFNDGLSAGIRDFDSDIAAALRRVTGGTLAGGRLTPPPAVIPAAPAPAALPVATPGGLTALLARIGLDDPARVATAADAQQLVDGLKQASPAKGTAKILKVTGAQRKGTVTRKFINQTMNDLVEFLPPALVKQLPQITIQVVRTSGTAAGSYNKGTQVLKLAHLGLQDPAVARQTIFHELMHWTHDHGPQEFRDEIAAYYAARTAGETSVRLRPWNDSRIMGMRDHWLDADGSEYAARIYPWESTPEGLEVVTRHLEKLAAAAELAKNWNHAAPDGSFLWREAFLTCAKILYPWP